ncbi:TPA: hypothetical protein ACYRR4_003646 [Proteus mirabilis]
MNYHLFPLNYMIINIALSSFCLRPSGTLIADGYVEMAYQGAGAVSCFSISPPVLSPNQQTVIPETIACWLPCLTA